MVPEVHNVAASSVLKYSLGCFPSALLRLATSSSSPQAPVLCEPVLKEN